MSALRPAPLLSASPPGAPGAPGASPGADAESAAWRVRLLGGFEMDDGHQRLTRLRSRAAMALLARLAAAPERAHGREELAALLWPEADADSGRSRLRQTLSLLRAVLEPPGAQPVLLADRRVLRAMPGALWCDVPAFERAWRAGQRAQAQALYRGELLPGFFDEWIVDERQRLQALAERLAERGAQLPLPSPLPLPFPSPASGGAGVRTAPPAHTASSTASPTALTHGPAARLPHYATRLIGADVQGARLLAQACEHRLVSVLGPGGSGKTRLAVEVARLACSAPPDRDRSQPGDVRFDHAVFVPLVGATSRSHLLDRLQMALRLEGAGDAMEQLLTALDGRAVLVVLDNAEQLHDDAAQAVAELVEQLPAAHWMVTSRRPLELDGERHFRLEALDLPAADAPLEEVAMNPAVALFVDRARAHRPDFHVGPGNRAALAALVAWLDGLPLAIELAASQSRTLGPGELLALLQAARLGQGGHAGGGQAGSGQAGVGQAADAPGEPASLAFLTRRGPRSGTDARQASMLAVIAWSWQLLAPTQRLMVSALSLLPSGATLEAAAALTNAFGPVADDEEPAQAIAPAVRPAIHPHGQPQPQPQPQPHRQTQTQTLLDQLVACSVLRSSVGQDSQRRYLPLEPVREFALAQHGAATLRRARGRRLAQLLDWARALPATPPLPTVREELPNLLQALAQAPQDGDGNAALRLVLVLQSSWGEIALPHSGLQVLDALLASPGLDDSLAAGGHAMAAWCWYEAARRDAALPHLQAAFARPCTDPELQVMVLSRGARLHWRLNRDDRTARTLIAQALPLARAVGRANSEASLLSLQAHLCTVVDRDHARATALSAQALALWQRSGNRHLVNAGRYNVAVAGYRAGRSADVLDELQALADEGLALQDWDLASGALEAHGSALLALRRWPEAAVSLHKSLAVAWDGLQMVAVMYALWNCTPVLARLRHGALAAETMAMCATQWRQRCGDFDPSDRRDLKRLRRFARVLLGPQAAQAAWDRGSSRTLADGVRTVLAQLHPAPTAPSV